MALTGHETGPPLISPAPAYGLLREAVRLLSAMTGDTGPRVEVDAAEILSGRAGLRGLRRAGLRSAGGTSRLLRTADGWCAVTLARPDDIESVPAILGCAPVTDPWAALEEAVTHWPAAVFADRAQLLGVPAAALPAAPGNAPPWHTTRISAPTAATSMRGRLIVDLSSMWAGPLCARLLGLAGARVVKVESLHRPDGARHGDTRFFEWLHSGHEFRGIDFRSTGGRAELSELIDTADIVIEASRPRALAQLGLAPEHREHHAGKVWMSITGYGRADPARVAFGDDAAVAGGLVGRHGGEPAFCADAIADPLSGICAALAAVSAVRAGGGVLIDLSMRDTAAAFASAPALRHGDHPVRRGADGWIVECPERRRSQTVLPPHILQQG
ncbi:CoA transferase [Nocardia sp. NPDC006630]|uniref:CoA transferase n=1 Tax=Nocardia sp. NPDC006630 TaxID=3157181 RepID=UPI0033BAB352